jgi:hypothetical protein
MPTYIVELPSSAPAVNGVRSIVVDAHNQDTARQMAGYYSNSSVANWDTATVRLVSSRDDLLGWKIAVDVREYVVNDNNDTEFRTLFNFGKLPPDPIVVQNGAYIYTCAAETLGSALARVAFDLNRIPGDEGSPDVDITPSLSGNGDIGYTLTVTAAGDELGKGILDIGVFPPGVPVNLSPRTGGAHGITGFITSVSTGNYVDFGQGNFDRSENDTLHAVFVGDGWTIPGIPDAGTSDGGSGPTGGAGDPDSTPPDPGSGSGSGGGSDGSGGSGDAPGENTQGPDGDPPRPPVGLDPRDIESGEVSAWWRSDQLIGKIFGRTAIHALGNMMLSTSELRDKSVGDFSGLAAKPLYTRISEEFNGHPAIAVGSPNGYMASNTDSPGLPNDLDIHVFFIVREISHVLNAPWLGGSADNVFSVIKNAETTVAMRNAGNTNWVNAATIPADGSAFLLEMRWSGESGDFIRVNGGAKNGSAAAGSGDVNFHVIGETVTGGAARADIEFAELIRVEGELVGTELQGLYDYLANRYDIVIDPPVA